MNTAQLLLEVSDSTLITAVGSADARTSLNSGELKTRTIALSQALLKLGVRSGGSIVVVGGSRVEILESILASINIGAAAVPLSPLIGTAHITGIISTLQPQCCIFEDTPDDITFQDLVSRRIPLVIIKAQSSTTYGGSLAYSNLIATGPNGARFLDHAPTSLAIIIHGSGSSGALKAIGYTHRTLLAFLEYNRLLFSQYSDGPDTLTCSAATVSSLPLSHLAGLGNCLVSILNRQSTFLLQSFVPRLYLQLIAEARCSHIVLVPSQYRALLSDSTLNSIDKSALRFCIVGGEPCTPELQDEIEAAFGVPLVSAYGMTECLSGIGHLRQDLFCGSIARGSCGRQLFGEITLRRADSSENSAFGELWVRNATVAQCYIDPILNQQRFFEGWFRTGDLFERDSVGNFFYRGRIDDMFYCNGKNIYPIEIERLLVAHPLIREVCAAPVTLPNGQRAPGVAVVATSAVTESEIKQFCMQRGQAHAVPQVVRFVSSLPTIGPGKVDRRAVQILLGAGTVG